MPEVTVGKPSRMTLKEGAKVEPSVGICRSCFIDHRCSDKPSAAYVREEICAVRGCENKCAVKVSFSPYEIDQPKQ